MCDNSDSQSPMIAPRKCRIYLRPVRVENSDVTGRVRYNKKKKLWESNIEVPANQEVTTDSWDESFEEEDNAPRRVRVPHSSTEEANDQELYLITLSSDETNSETHSKRSTGSSRSKADKGADVKTNLRRSTRSSALEVMKRTGAGCSGAKSSSRTPRKDAELSEPTSARKSSKKARQSRKKITRREISQNENESEEDVFYEPRREVKERLDPFSDNEEIPLSTLRSHSTHEKVNTIVPNTKLETKPNKSLERGKDSRKSLERKKRTLPQTLMEPFVVASKVDSEAKTPQSHSVQLDHSKCESTPLRRSTLADITNESTTPRHFEHLKKYRANDNKPSSSDSKSDTAANFSPSSRLENPGTLKTPSNRDNNQGTICTPRTPIMAGKKSRRSRSVRKTGQCEPYRSEDDDTERSPRTAVKNLNSVKRILDKKTPSTPDNNEGTICTLHTSMVAVKISRRSRSVRKTGQGESYCSEDDGTERTPRTAVKNPNSAKRTLHKDSNVSKFISTPKSSKKAYRSQTKVTLSESEEIFVVSGEHSSRLRTRRGEEGPADDHEIALSQVNRRLYVCSDSTHEKVGLILPVTESESKPNKSSEKGKDSRTLLKRKKDTPKKSIVAASSEPRTRSQRAKRTSRSRTMELDCSESESTPAARSLRSKVEVTANETTIFRYSERLKKRRGSLATEVNDDIEDDEPCFSSVSSDMESDASDYSPQSSLGNPRTSKTRRILSHSQGTRTPLRTPRINVRALTPSLPTRSSRTTSPATPRDRAMKVLHISSVPESLPCRQREFDTIYNFLSKKLKGMDGGFMYIYGVPGAGKTATVERVIKRLKLESSRKKIRKFTFVDINGMHLKQSKDVYRQIWNKLEGNLVSANTARRLLEDKFRIASTKEPILFLFDEFDMLFNRTLSVIDTLLDWIDQSKLIVVGIANSKDLIEEIHRSSSKSRLLRERLCDVQFQTYTFQQLHEIIEDRLKEDRVFTSDAIQFLARKSALSGDVRLALNLCRRVLVEAGNDVGKEPITVYQVTNILDKIYKDPKIELMRGLSKQEQVLLRAIRDAILISGFSTCSLEKNVYEHYRNLCIFDGLKLKDEFSLFRQLRLLEKYAIITLSNTDCTIHTEISLGNNLDLIQIAFPPRIH